MPLSTIATLEAQIEGLDHEIRKEHEPLLDRMKKAAGIADVSSREILAEIGPTLDNSPRTRRWHRGAVCAPATTKAPGNARAAGAR